MAKYDITHTCGHSRTVALYGKLNERERKIEWMASQDCPSCWAAKKRESDALKPITATISLLPFLGARGHVPVFQIALTGGTEPRKEEIKALGYKWGDICGNFMEMLSFRRPQMGWVRKIEWITDDDVAASIVALAPLNPKVVNNIKPWDVALLKEKQAMHEAQEASVSAIPRPERPACYPVGRWNGKIYGGFRIYVDGEEVRLNKADAQAIVAYQTAMASYKEACVKVREQVA